MILFKGTDKSEEDDVYPEVTTEVYDADLIVSGETVTGDPDAGNTDQGDTDAGDHFELNESPEEGIDENIEDELPGRPRRRRPGPRGSGRRRPGPGRPEPRPDTDPEADDDENKETADEAHEEFEGESSEDLKPVDDDLGHDYEELDMTDEGVKEQFPKDLNTVDEESENANEEDEQLDIGQYEDLNSIEGELETDEALKNSDKTFSEELTEEGSHEELSEATETAEEDPEITDKIVKTPRKGLKNSNEDVAGESQEVNDDTSSNANTEDNKVFGDEYYDESHEEPEDNKITPSSESDGGNSRPNLKVGNRDLQTSDDDYAEDPEYPEGANDDNDHTLDDADEKEFAEDFAEDTDDALTDDTNAGDNPGDIVEDDGLTTQEYYDESHEDSEDNEITHILSSRSGSDGGNGPPESKTGTRTGNLDSGDDDYAEDPEYPEDENYDHSHEDSEGEVPENNDENYEDSEGEVPESNDENYDDNHEDSEEYEEYSEHDIDDEKG